MTPHIENGTVCGEHIKLVKELTVVRVKLEQVDERGKRIEDKLDKLSEQRYNNRDKDEGGGNPWSGKIKWLIGAGSLLGGILAGVASAVGLGS